MHCPVCGKENKVISLKRWVGKELLCTKCIYIYTQVKKHIRDMKEALNSG